MRRINNQTMRENNIRIILNTIRKNGSISRADLSKQLGLTSPAVTNIVSNLIQDGLLIETGYTDSALGRKPILLSINPTICYLLGMVITTESATVVAADFSAKILYTEQREINPLADKDMLLDILIDCAKTCMANASISREQILGMGIAAPGPLDTQKGILWNPPNFPYWQNLPICSIMEDALGIPTVLDKETNAAALAEYYFGLKEEVKTMFLMLVWRNSIGGSVMFNGNVLHGFEDGSGDIGHSLVDINGPLCSCGRYGCLERVASGNALVNRAKAKLRSMNNMKLPVPCVADDLTLDDIFKFSNLGIPLFEETVDYAAQMIATAIGNVISILSPSLFVIGGPLTVMSPTLVSKIQTYVHNRSYPESVKRIRIESSTLGDAGCALGAVMLALDKYQTRLCQQGPASVLD